jgi:DNA-binding response OmpR family regulator
MGRRILIVDDEPYILKIVSFKLRRAGFVALEASDPSTAWTMAITQRPDLVLLDVGLGTDVDGFELAERLRAHDATRRIPIIMLTARALTEDIVRGRQVGADGYITKPFSPTEVIDKVTTILGE